MANLGPATTQTANTVLVTTPVNTQTNSYPQEANQSRLIGVLRGVSLATTGDNSIQIINCASWQLTAMIVTNSQISGAAGSIATASVGLFTAGASGGTALKAQAALSSNTTGPTVFSATLTNAGVSYGVQTVYVNCGTALAGATADIFLYGLDLS